MKNWDKLETDENRILSKHYTSGRSGKDIDRIVIHHNAGNLSIAQIYNTWQSRRASAHYQVDKNGRIGQLVWDSDTAWHAANSDANARSIGIEHANNTFSPSWTVSDKTLEEGAHLVAAICVHHKLGRPSWGKNVFPHSRYSSTSCPGALQGSQQSKYMSRAKAWYDSMTGGKAPSKPKPKPKPKKLDVDGKLGPKTARAYQKHFGSKADGMLGRNSWKAGQRKLGTPADGVVSSQSYRASELGTAIVSGWDFDGRGSGGSPFVRALQRRVGSSADGIWGPKTTKALQSYLND